MCCMKLDPNTHRGQVILAVVIRAALAKRAVDLKEEAAGQDQPAPGVTARIVERTPHMDVSPQPPLRPGMAFTVRVYVDREKARPGEDTETVAVEDGARVQVRLVVTPHFAVKSSPVDWIEIRGTQDRSEAPAFHLRVKSADKLRGHKPKANVPPPAIIALFFHNGRPSGKVSRKIDIMDFAAITPPPGAAPEATLESTPPPAPMIAIDPAAIPADLNVTVAEIDGSGGLHFSCTVQTDLLDDYRQGAEGPWPFKQGTDVIVRSYMDQFTRKKSPLATGLELRGAGLKFFEAAPKVFKKALWALIDAKKPLKSISIVSQEPYFPWELIIPCRDNERRDPLGVEFSIGRWVDRNVVSGRQQNSPGR